MALKASATAPSWRREPPGMGSAVISVPGGAPREGSPRPGGPGELARRSPGYPADLPPGGAASQVVRLRLPCGGLRRQRTLPCREQCQARISLELN